MSLVLFGLPFPSSKKVSHALPLLYGIGTPRANEICRLLGFPAALRIRDLSQGQELALAKRLKEDYVVAGNLEEQQKLDFLRYYQNGSQRGHRLRQGLPVRGQRTHSNGKTARATRSSRRSLFYRKNRVKKRENIR